MNVLLVFAAVLQRRREFNFSQVEFGEEELETWYRDTARNNQMWCFWLILELSLTTRDKRMLTRGRYFRLFTSYI